MPAFRNHRLFLVLACLAVASACSRAPSARFGSGLARIPAAPEIRRDERAQFELLNQDRAAHGLPPLQYDDALAEIARYHSADMRDHRFFAHESPTSGSLDDRLNAAGYLFLAARENLSEAPDVKRSQESLMKSPGHRENILSRDVTHVGIGIVRGGVEDPKNLLVTQVFARPGKAESADEARAAIVRSLTRARRDRGLAPARESALLAELAEEHVASLGSAGSPEDLAPVGKAIAEAVAGLGSDAPQGLVAGAQLLPQSSELEIPSQFLELRSASYGLAVREVRGPTGRPMIQVLLLIAR
ncbi:MAG TPA: CAP domain-containing protein [Polyangiaceae bacterium]|nr:CAP domain-containing protein [Polyangiaceae bacterium]